MTTEIDGGVVKTFMDAVQIDSPTGKEQKMAGYVLNKLDALGLNPQIDKEGNVVAFFDGDPNKEPYFLNAHLDTVQGDTHVEPMIDSDGWIRPRGETILGADNKTAVAAILDVVTDLVEKKSTSHHPLDLVFTVSEESNNHGAIGLDYKRLHSKKGFSFDGGSDIQGDITLSSPFYERFDFKLIGKSGHAGKPHEAVNVLPAAARAILASPIGKVNEKTVANIAYIGMGETKADGKAIVNTIPGEIVISGEVRSTDEKMLIDTRNTILSAFLINSKEAGLKMVGLDKPDTFYTRENPGFEYSENDPFVVHTLNLLKNLNMNPNFMHPMGCYDANLFIGNGVQVLNIADGSLDNHSKGNERIKVEVLESLQRMIYQLVTQ